MTARQWFFLVLSIVGLLVTWTFNLQFMREQCALGLPLGMTEEQAEQRLTMAGFTVDYAEIRRSDLSRPKAPNEPGLLALIAARLGRTRLIDNLEFDAV